MVKPANDGPSGHRNAKGQFTAGNRFGKGNPDARRRGRLIEAARAAVTEADLAEVMMAMCVAAKEGDHNAARILLERCIGKPRVEQASISLELPELDTPAGLAEGMRRIAQATAVGEIEPDAAAQLTYLLRQVSDATHVEDLRAQVDLLLDERKRN